MKKEEKLPTVPALVALRDVIALLRLEWRRRELAEQERPDPREAGW